MRKFLYDVRFVFTLIFVWGSCFSIYLPILLSNIFNPCQMMFVLLNSNMKGATSGAGTAYTYGDIEFTTGYLGVRVTRTLVFCVMFCRSLFVLLSSFFWPLCCLSFDLRNLITPI